LKIKSFGFETHAQSLNLKASSIWAMGTNEIIPKSRQASLEINYNSKTLSDRKVPNFHSDSASSKILNI
jgi:hypothetical protein